jgi:glycosyltransferase involved in cell wall biosynthesis
MKLSIIIPYHNEGIEFITETINQIKSTIDFNDFEIIVIDDYSEIPLSLNGIKVVRHTVNKGVGAAFDTGVKHACSENLMLIGSDIRFIKNGWSSLLLHEIENHPKSFTCTSCVALNAEEKDILKRRNVNTGIGATILFFHDHKSNPAKPKSFKGILEAKWLPKTNNRDVDSYEIPCILGAAYGVKKSWYEYCDGFALHRKWGTLEPYISFKSWLFGGSCRVAPRIELGHIFKKAGTHGTQQDILIYNKLMVSRLFFDDFKRLHDFLGMNSIVARGFELYNETLPDILQKQKEYQSKTTMSIQSFAERFGIDYRI